jgi:hypothetical protein
MPNDSATGKSRLDETIDQLRVEFDQQRVARLVMGEEQYGRTAFLNVDTLDMALEEVVDLANYAMMTFVKIRLLQMATEFIPLKEQFE